MVEGIVFALAAIVGVGAAVCMVVSRNAVHGALYLVATQVAIAVMFLLQGAFFIAALQVIVYAGAIMVLFIFVIMLLGVDQKESLIEPLPMQVPIALGLGFLLLGQALFLGLKAFEPNDLAGVEPISTPLVGEGNVEAIARVLFTRWAFPFEATSVLLVVAVVGVMVLAKRNVATDLEGSSGSRESHEVGP